MILGRSSNPTTNEFDNIDFNISTEACAYTEIISDATEELAALESALYVADVMLEEKALEGATPEEMEVLLEGVMTSMYGRLKEVLKKLMAKVKQWFANVKKFFQILFSHGKDFAKKYRADIVKAQARAKGFKYKTYDFNGGWGALLDMYDGKKILDIDPLDKADDILKNAKEGTSTTELVKQYMQTNHWGGGKFDSQAEYNKEVKEALYGGSFEREEFEDFSKGPSVQDMLKVLEQGSKCIANIDKSERGIQNQCSKTLREIEKAEREAAKEVKAGEKLSRRYSLATEICKAVANAIIGGLDIYKEAIKTATRDAESILKSLLRHKPAKEGFEGEEFDEGTESILESAFKLL